MRVIYEPNLLLRYRILKCCINSFFKSLNKLNSIKLRVTLCQWTEWSIGFFGYTEEFLPRQHSVRIALLFSVLSSFYFIDKISATGMMNKNHIFRILKYEVLFSKTRVQLSSLSVFSLFLTALKATFQLTRQRCFLSIRHYFREVRLVSTKISFLSTWILDPLRASVPSTFYVRTVILAQFM